MLRITLCLYIPHKKLVSMDSGYPGKLHKIFNKKLLITSHKYFQHLIYKRLRIGIFHEEVNQKLESIVLELGIDFKYLLKKTEYLVIVDLSKTLNNIDDTLQKQDQIDFCYGVTYTSNQSRCKD
jgi:hypothetical protein